MKVGLINEDTHYMKSLGPCTNQELEEKTDLIIESVNKHNLDILIAPEWYYLKLPHFTKEEKEKTLEKIINHTPKESLIIPGTFIWIYKEIKRIFQKNQLSLKNTAPIINNGEVQEYHKYKLSGESGEFDLANLSGNQNQCFKPMGGLEQGKKFTWKNLNIGLEICADHNFGCLKLGKHRKLDLQLVIACGIPFKKKKTVIRNKGYIIFCDGFNGFDLRDLKLKEKLNNRIFQKNKDKFNKIQPVRYTRDLDLYELEI